MSAPRLIGRLAIAGLQFIGSAREFMQGEPEAACDSVGDIPGGIGYTALKASNRGGVEVGSVSQSLLSQADLFSAQSDSSAEGDLRGLADPHI